MALYHSQTPHHVINVVIYREQQYVQMWSELEGMVRAHSDTSPMHQKVLECLLECKKPSDDAKARKQGDKVLSREEKMDITEMENTWKELDRCVILYPAILLYSYIFFKIKYFVDQFFQLFKLFYSED